MSNDGKMQVFICNDHFERLCNGDVCATCPSRAENKEAVVALSKLYQQKPEQFNQAVLTEIQSIRKGQQHFSVQIGSLQDAIHGNGQEGMKTRVAVLEERYEHLAEAQDRRQSSSALYAQWIAIGVSALIGICSLIIAKG